MHRYAAISATLFLLGTGVAAAQTAPAPCAPANGSRGTVGSGGTDPNLSDRLAKANGVICPPTNVDPEMQKPAPGGGRIRVIPPPGRPGGDQGTVPK